ncbi:spore coat protein [Metabacillus sp. FJAT-53654]|uniref:Spore coat protein n=1 Tax=Metabacillus rhizosphaerae TaxID=3117747 RepID=A0ABZ2MN67_9BACI
MATKDIAMHEKLEVHEVLLFKTSCVKKGTAMLELVEDKDLKQILEEDVEASTNAVKKLSKILEKA